MSKSLSWSRIAQKLDLSIIFLLCSKTTSSLEDNGEILSIASTFHFNVNVCNNFGFLNASTYSALIWFNIGFWIPSSSWSFIFVSCFIGSGIDLLTLSFWTDLTSSFFISVSSFFSSGFISFFGVSFFSVTGVTGILACWIVFLEP